MRVAIYARYSSENQSEKSIDDQVRVCKKYIQQKGYFNEEKHIYIDEAISGSVINRPGLQALEKAAENKEIDAVAVDDLSRLSRSNHQMLTLVLKFNYLQIKLISVSDGIVADDENAKLGIHIRGFMNELYLDDLKKKTMRGLEGQKLRGFSAGESVYGYSTHPVGELKLNKKGVARYEGRVHKINVEEAEIVKRIFKEFIDGKSIYKIVEGLNKDKVLTKRGSNGGWNTSTVSRILKNEKYTGRWVWRKYKNVRDPMTGKIKKVPRAKEEQLESFKEELAILDLETWDKVQKRRKEMEGSHPVRKGKKIKQKSYVYSNPTHLLAGLMKCYKCDGAIVQVGGKAGGYYGCYNGKRKTCDNTILVQRKRVEKSILSDLKEKILIRENVEYVLKKVEQLVAKGLNEVPEQMKKKKAQHEKVLVEIQNYLNFIKTGNLSTAVSEALKDAEGRGETLKEEIKSFEFQKENSFKTPPKEWIEHRLSEFHKVMERNTTASALALKGILSPIKMEAVTKKEEDPYYLMTGGIGFKPYYVAHTRIQTLALLDERHKGSNWLHWRRG